MQRCARRWAGAPSRPLSRCSRRGRRPFRAAAAWGTERAPSAAWRSRWACRSHWAEPKMAATLSVLRLPHISSPSCPPSLPGCGGWACQAADWMRGAGMWQGLSAPWHHSLFGMPCERLAKLEVKSSCGALRSAVALCWDGWSRWRLWPVQQATSGSRRKPSAQVDISEVYRGQLTLPTLCR